MTDIISKRKEESMFGEGKGEAERMLGSARVKLIQCRMKGSFSRLDPPQWEAVRKRKRPFNHKQGI